MLSANDAETNEPVTCSIFGSHNGWRIKTATTFVSNKLNINQTFVRKNTFHNYGQLLIIVNKRTNLLKQQLLNRCVKHRMKQYRKVKLHCRNNTTNVTSYTN